MKNIKYYFSSVYFIKNRIADRIAYFGLRLAGFSLGFIILVHIFSHVRGFYSLNLAIVPLYKLLAALGFIGIGITLLDIFLQWVMDDLSEKIRRCKRNREIRKGNI